MSYLDLVFANAHSAMNNIVVHMNTGSSSVSEGKKPVKNSESVSSSEQGESVSSSEEESKFKQDRADASLERYAKMKQYNTQYREGSFIYNRFDVTMLSALRLCIERQFSDYPLFKDLNSTPQHEEVRR